MARQSAQHAGDADDIGAPWPEAPPPPDDLDAVILRRGSTRIMDSGATISRDLYTACLNLGMRGTQTTEFIAVHGVDDVEPRLIRTVRGFGYSIREPEAHQGP